MPDWEARCSRVQLIVNVLREARPSQPGQPMPDPKPDLNQVQIHRDAEGRETYYRRWRGGRVILASPELGYDAVKGGDDE